MYQHIEKTRWMEKLYLKIDKRFRETPFVNKLNNIMKDCFSNNCELHTYSFKNETMYLLYREKKEYDSYNEYTYINLKFPQNYFEKKHNKIIEKILRNSKNDEIFEINEKERINLEKMKKNLSKDFKNEIKRLQRELEDCLNKEYYGNNCRPYPGIKYGMRDRYLETKKRLNELQRIKEK